MKFSLTDLLWYSMGNLIQIYLSTAVVNCDVMMPLSILNSLIQKSAAQPTMYKIHKNPLQKEELVYNGVPIAQTVPGPEQEAVQYRIDNHPHY